MHDDSRGKPFATATVPRTREYFVEMYRLLMRQARVSSGLLIAFSMVVLGYGLYVFSWTGNSFLLYLLSGYAVFVLAVRWFQRWKWLRDRLADLPRENNEMTMSFFEETLVVSTALSAAEVDWQAMYKVVHEEEGLLIYPQRGAVFYIPQNQLNPLSAVAAIMQKVNKEVAS